MISSNPERGAYIPFPEPVVGPDFDIREGPCGYLVFNTYWRPYILGALKVLARPETWKADTQEEIDDLVEQGMHLQCLIPGVQNAPADTPCSPDAFLILDGSGPGVNTQIALGTVNTLNELCYAVASMNTTCDAGVVNWHLEDINGNPVGAIVRVFAFAIDQTIIPPFASYQYLDCNNTYHTFSGANQGFLINPTDIQSLSATVTGGMLMMVTILSKVQCGPA